MPPLDFIIPGFSPQIHYESLNESDRIRKTYDAIF